MNTHLFRIRIVTCLFVSIATAPLPAQTTPLARDGGEEKIVELSPFVVPGDEDDGYRATSTLAGTRIKTNLRDVGAAISVITEQFLRDTAARNSEDLLVYTLGTEIGGLSGNYTGTGNGVSLFESSLLLQPNMNNRVRGLGAAENARDFFRTDIPWDSYAVGRVDLQRGPNAILFGLGKPAGLLNANLNAAGFKNAASVSTRLGSFGSVRAALDVNRVLLKDELALRMDALEDRTYFRQDPAFNRDRRIYGALRYDPKFLRRGTARTSLRVNYEHGDIDANRPRTLPPVDRISPFFQTGTTTINGRTFNNLNQATFDIHFDQREPGRRPSADALNTNSPAYLPAVTTIFGGNLAYFPDPTTGQQAGNIFVPPNFASITQFGIGPSGAIDRTIGGVPTRNWVAVANLSDIAKRFGLPFANDYKNPTITDPSVYDFYHRLMDGPNKSERRSFEAANAVVSQTFWNNRAGIEAAFDRQDYAHAQDTILGSNIVITVDLNNQLLDNSPNPNVGRPMILNRSTDSAGGGMQTERRNSRVTAFGEVRAEDFLGRSALTRLLGRHVFTGVLSREQVDRANQAWARFVVNDGSGLLGTALAPDRELQIITYLGPDVRGRTSISGLNLTNLTAPLSVTANRVVTFDSRWRPPTNPALAGYVNPATPWVNPINGQTLTESENPSNYGGWGAYPVTILNAAGGDRARVTRSATKHRDKINSKVAVWQGFFWDGVVVPTVGYRKDTAKAYTVVAPLRTDGSADQNAPGFVLPGTPYNRVEGTTRSYSVVLHTPGFIRRRMPQGTNLSVFINRSENFEPAAGRVDILANPLPAPTGKTKDYGVVLSAFNDRLVLKVNRYESSAANASYALAGLPYIGAVESRAWVAAKRFEAGLTGDPQYAGVNYNYGTVVDGVFVQTPAERTLQEQHVRAALAAFYEPTWKAWRMTPNERRWQIAAYEPGGDGLGGGAPPGMTSTTDTLSKGYEYEVNFKPVRNWDIAFNAAKTDASRTRIAGNMKAYVEGRNTAWNGPAGDIRLFNGGPTAVTIKEDWNREFYRNYVLQQMLDGSNVPELRPWRFNVVTNYRFVGERLKGFSLGGAYRWEDKVVIGYPSMRATINGAQLDSFDITRPYRGATEASTDLWVGYERRLLPKVQWRVQLNVRNALGKNELVPINAQPDGAPAAYRIKEGPTWALSNTFTF